MSFTEFLQDDPQLTREQVMATLIQVADDLGLPDQRGAALIAGMIISQEVGVEDDDPPNERRFWCPANNADPESLNCQHDSLSDDGRSVGYFQQQKGPDGELWWGTTQSEMALSSAATTFMTRLNASGYDASNADGAATSGCAIQNPEDHAAYIASCSGFWDDINSLYDNVIGGTTPVTAPAPTDPRLAALEGVRPDFNEYPNWGPNSESRQNTPVDLWLIHTEENSGYDNADGLAKFLISTADTNNPVSYHYTISKGQNDDGVTVVDCIDTDLAAWAVGNSNLRSINLCFAGSSVSWTRDEWIANLGRCIDVAGYLCVQDSIKYGFGNVVIPGPQYGQNPPGISDHRYCTDWLKDGNTHVDVGDNFPWDLFQAAVTKYWAIANSTPVPPQAPAAPLPAPAPAPTGYQYPSTDDMIKQIWEQLFGPQATGFPALFGMTADGSRGKFTVEGVADIHKEVFPNGN